MTYARSGDKLLMHGSGGSRLMKLLKNGAEVCVEVTHLDALVLARSAFHHSMNYRSVVVFGKASVIDDDEAKMAAFQDFFEHVLPGRWLDARKPNHKELAQTAVIEVSLDEASAKIRTGPPADDEEDYELPIWAGLLPLELNAKPAVDDPKLGPGIDKPDYVRRYTGKRRK
jgi:nitroimidazol reductase NimA-like FMN-containing flavoprotein (pyridoxamine 5'-phosphate oxidase superfamily)